MNVCGNYTASHLPVELASATLHTNAPPAIDWVAANPIDRLEVIDL
jgi:hypothetical protein